MSRTKLDNFIGQKYNNWTVIDVKRGKYQSGKYYSHFICKCSCGIEQECNPTDIRNGKSTKCLKCKYKESQKRYNNLEGMKFNKWTVIKLYDRKNAKEHGYRKLIWECRCECGRTRYVQSSNLTQNLSKSCGLCDDRKQLENRLMKKLKHSKGNRKYEIDPTIDGKFLVDLMIQQNEKCALSGIPIYFSTSWHKHGTASLDRRDNNIGYTRDNVQWVHKDINKMKHAFNQDYFIKMCKLIGENN